MSSYTAYPNPQSSHSEHVVHPTEAQSSESTVCMAYWGNDVKAKGIIPKRFNFGLIISRAFLKQVPCENVNILPTPGIEETVVCRLGGLAVPHRSQGRTEHGQRDTRILNNAGTVTLSSCGLSPNY